MLDFKTETLEVKFNGNSYSVRFPTLRDSKALRDSMKEVGEDEAVISFLARLGLPEDVVENMTASHLTTLMEALNGKKK